MKFPKSLRFTIILITLIVLQSCVQTVERKNEKDNYNRVDEYGNKQGLWKFFNEEDVLIAEVNYINDLKIGQEVKYYASGEIWEEIEWDGNEFGSYKVGEYRHYWENGQALLEMTYDAGMPEGLFTLYHKNGQIDHTGQHSKGLKVGTWKYFNNEGILISDCNYTNYEQEWHEEFKSGLIKYYHPEAGLSHSELWVGGNLDTVAVFNDSLYQVMSSELIQ